jgi:hypothetical protein
MRRTNNGGYSMTDKKSWTDVSALVVAVASLAVSAFTYREQVKVSEYENLLLRCEPGRADTSWKLEGDHLLVPWRCNIKNTGRKTFSVEKIREESFGIAEEATILAPDKLEPVVTTLSIEPGHAVDFVYRQPIPLGNAQDQIRAIYGKDTELPGRAVANAAHRRCVMFEADDGPTEHLDVTASGGLTGLRPPRRTVVFCGGGMELGR